MRTPILSLADPNPLLYATHADASAFIARVAESRKSAHLRALAVVPYSNRFAITIMFTSNETWRTGQWFIQATDYPHKQQPEPARRR